MPGSPCSSVDRSCNLLEQDYDEGNVVAFCDKFHAGSSFNPHFTMFFVIDQFTADNASTRINATSHELSSLCWLACEEKILQLLDLL